MLVRSVRLVRRNSPLLVATAGWFAFALDYLAAGETCLDGTAGSFNSVDGQATCKASIVEADSGGLNLDDARVSDYGISKLGAALTSIRLSISGAQGLTIPIVGSSTPPDTVLFDVAKKISGGADAALFTIAGGNLLLKSAADFESDPHSYQVEVSAFDGVHSTAKTITVNLTDVNDSAAVISTAASASVAENTTLVAALISSDADSVGTNPAAFSISGGADAALFSIAGGNLLLKSAADFESDPHSYQVEVSAFDGVHSTAKTITVNLTDVFGSFAGTTGTDTLVGTSEEDTIDGFAGNDTIIGGAGNDMIIGGMGTDILTGGSGADGFVFKSSTEGIDQITDFSASQGDHIDILASIFGGGLTTGTNLATVFGSSATDIFGSGSERFHYNTLTHTLLFDADGSGIGASNPLATFLSLAALTSNDFHLI